MPDLYGWCILEVPSSTDISGLISQLKRESSVERAEPDYFAYPTEVIPNDSDFSLQWHHKNTGQTGGLPGADIKTSILWSRATGSSSVKIAVLDTGIQLDHPDLAANLITGYNFVDNNTNPNDDDGHGTHVAGIIAARGNNGTQVAGIMWQASLMPIKVCGAGLSGCPDSAIAGGLQFAADNGAQVINMSLGGPTDSDIIKNAVDYAVGLGVVVVAAAGNSGDEVKIYPAAYTNVISVAATNHNDRLAELSTRGTWVTLSAPGEDIVSTVLGSSTATYSGTSMASPMVAGAAGMIISRSPGISAQGVRTRLLSTADSIDNQNPTLIGKMGAGRLNVLKAAADVPTVVSFSGVPNVDSLSNGGVITSFSIAISSDIAAPQVTAMVTDQNDRPLTLDSSLSYSVSGETTITGSLSLGNVSLDYPLTSRIKLRVALNDGTYVNTVDAKVWNFGELSAAPPGGRAAVWNGIFDPMDGGKATVRVALDNPGHIKIRVMTPDGTLVRTLADEHASLGIQSWDWSGSNDRGSIVASGLYLIHVVAPGIDEIKKAIVIK